MTLVEFTTDDWTVPPRTCWIPVEMVLTFQATFLHTRNPPEDRTPVYSGTDIVLVTGGKVHVLEDADVVKQRLREARTYDHRG